MNGCNIQSNDRRKIIGDFFRLFSEYRTREDEKRDEWLGSEIKNILTGIRINYIGADAKIAADSIIKAADEYDMLETLLANDNDDVASWFKDGGAKIITYLSRDPSQELAWDVNEVTTELLSETLAMKYNRNTKFLNKGFGTAIKAMNYSMLRMNAMIVESCFINRGDFIRNREVAGIVHTTTEMNQNLIRLLEKLFDDIRQYLRALVDTNVINGDTLPDEVRAFIDNANGDYTLFRHNNRTNRDEATPAFDVILTYLKGVLNYQPSELSNFFARKNNMNLSDSVRERARMALNAYSGLLFLNNFDSYLRAFIGKSLKINGNQFGIRVASNDKYQISAKNLYGNSTWRTGEEIYVGDEVNNVTKMIVLATPLLKWGLSIDNFDSSNSSKFLKFQHFQHIVPKLRMVLMSKDAEEVEFGREYMNQEWVRNMSEETQDTIRGKKLSTVVAEAVHSPRTTWHAIFELISQLEFRNNYPLIYNNFDISEIDVLYSIAKGLFSGNKSVYASQQPNSDLDYYGYLTQVANTIYGVEFTQLYYDNDGQIRTRNLIDLSTKNIQNRLQTTINSLNSTRHDKWDSVVDKFNNSFLETINANNKLEKLSFVIPNTNVKLEVSYTGTVIPIYLGKTGIGSRDLVENLYTFDYDGRRDSTYRNFLSFINYTLGLNLINEVDFQNILREKYTNSNNRMLLGLLTFAGHVVANRYVANVTLQKEGVTYDNITNYVVYDKSMLPRFDYLLNEMETVSNYDFSNLLRIANARADLLGYNSAIFVKDSEGNNLSKQTFNRMMASYGTLFELTEKTPLSASRHFMLLNNKDLFKGLYVSKEFVNSEGDKKTYSQMSTQELAYTQFKHAYVASKLNPSALSKSIVGGGKALFYLSVISDRSLFPQIYVDLTAPIEQLGLDATGTNYRTLNSLDNDELIRFISSELGQYYTKAYENVVNILGKVDDFILSRYAEPLGIDRKKYVSLSKDFINDFDSFNDWYNKNLASRLNKSAVDFVRDAVVEHNADLANFNNKIKLTDQIHFKDSGGNLKTNRSFVQLIYRYTRGKLSSDILKHAKKGEIFLTDNEFWDETDRMIFKSMIESGFEIDLNDGTEESEYLKNDTFKLPDSAGRTWINEDDKMILGYAVCEGIEEGARVLYEIPITNLTDLVFEGINVDNFTLENGNKLLGIVINPEIRKWNLLDFLLTQEFMNSTAGSFIAHPDKSKSGNPFALESSQTISMYKRNNVLASSVDQFLLNDLDGIPSIYNIAVIDEFEDICPTINGVNNSVDTSNAMTWVNPFFVHLENKSLKGSEVGITKKPFVVFRDPDTGTGGEDKTACFGITNNLMKESKILRRMMKKLTDKRWVDMNGNPIFVDITLDSMNPNNNVLYSDKFYRGTKVVSENGQDRLTRAYYHIIGIKYNGDGEYIRTVLEVDEYGNPIMVDAVDENGRPTKVINTIEETKSVTSNYALWDLFGGYDSMEYNQQFKKLVSSENSIIDVVTAMNRTGYIIHNGNGEILRDENNNPITYKNYNGIKDQRYIWQPLKRSDISWMTTKEAMKYGSGNINKPDVILDENNESPFGYFLVDMLNAGTQLDKEHSADESELSMMTQVLNACALRGYTFGEAEELYSVVRAQTDAITRLYITPLREVYQLDSEADISRFNQVIIEKIVKELSNGNNPNTASNIAQQIIEESKTDKSRIRLMPLSDNTVYNKVVSTVAVFLTNMGIRSKVSGILSVLSPSDNIFMLYDNRKLSSFVDPDNELKEIQDDYNKNKAIYQSDDPTKNKWESISNVELGRKYYVTRRVMSIDEGGNEIPTNELSTKSELIRTPNEYYKLKYDAAIGHVTKIVEDIQSGRNLNAYNVRFNNEYQLWDLDCMANIFRLHELTNDDWDELIGIYVDMFDSTPNWMPDTDNFALRKKETELFIRRVQLKELLALTVNAPDLRGQYRQIERETDAVMLNNNISDEDKRAALNKYALWINIYFGTGKGNTICLDNNGLFAFSGNDLLIDGANYNAIKKAVQNAINKSVKVRIDGKYVDVDKSTIKVLAYENISNKTNMTAFGLDSEADLRTIEYDKDYFIKLFLRNQSTLVNENQYNIELKQSNGKHIYLMLKSALGNADAKNLTLQHNILYDEDDGVTYRVDMGGNIIYELRPGVNVYSDGEHEVIVVPESGEDGLDNLVFYLNELSYDDVNVSTNSYDNANYGVNKMMVALNRSENHVANNYVTNITKNGEIYDPFDIVAAIRNRRQNNIVSNINNSDAVSSWIRKNPNNIIVRRGREKHTSFLRSLDLVAARIPALCMQSFMAMRTVAFDNPDINNVYVSSYQILILGSDFDIDTVSLALFNIDRNGILLLWSPYADISNNDMREASEYLPYPTGKVVETTSLENEEQIKNEVNNDAVFLAKYLGGKNNTILVRNNRNHVAVSVESVSKMNRLNEFLREANIFKNPNNINDTDLVALNELLKIINKNKILKTFFSKFITELDGQLNTDVVGRVVNDITAIINKHNMYAAKASDDRRKRMTTNFIVKCMYNISKSPSNLIQSQESVDGCTEPVKRLIDEKMKNTPANYFGPGNVFAKFQSMYNTLVGKEGVGIFAVSTKVLDGLSQYFNGLLNNGDAIALNKVLLGKDGNGVTINGKTYYTLSNVRSMNPNTIVNDNVRYALSNVTQDEDAGIWTSAMMSLAVDNAKELRLYQLNATPRTMGIYSYGIAIGMDFLELADIMMSPTGKLITKLVNSNLFSDLNNPNTISLACDYFNRMPEQILGQFRGKRGQRSLITLNRLLGEEELLKNYNEYADGDDKIEFERGRAFGINFAKFAGETSISLDDKLNMLMNIKYSNDLNGKAKQKMNKLIDFLMDYTILAHTVATDTIGNIKRIDSIRELSEGAEEFRVLGLLFGFNKGIETSMVDLFRLLSNIESAIYNRKGSNGRNSDLIDVTRFWFDKEYQALKIAEYEKVKHSINILDALVNVPHFSGYLQTFATAVKGMESSFKFRSVRRMLPLVRQIMRIKRSKQQRQLVRGIESYISDYMRNEWLRQQAPIAIPANNWIFLRDGTYQDSQNSTVIPLGTEWTNATFRAWMEREVVPNLQNSPNSTISNNMFIQMLGYSNLTDSVSGTATTVLSLPINMMPRSDYERDVINEFREEFNKLASVPYTYTVTEFRQNKPVEIQKQIPLLDLFTYYTMIAHSWRIRENSLLPILDSFINTGKYKSFLEYEAAFDNSDYTLEVDEVLPEELIPYVAARGNPWSDSGEWIWWTNRREHKRLLMQMEQKSDDSGQQLAEVDPEVVGENNNVGRYFPNMKIYNTHYFLLGTSTEQRDLRFGFDIEDVNNEQLPEAFHVSINFKYDPVSRNLNTLSFKFKDKNYDVDIKNISPREYLRTFNRMTMFNTDFFKLKVRQEINKNKLVKSACE